MATVAGFGPTIIGGSRRAIASVQEEAKTYEFVVASLYFNNLLLAWNPAPVALWSGMGHPTLTEYPARLANRRVLYAHLMLDQRSTVYADHPDFQLAGTDGFGVAHWDSQSLRYLFVRTRNGASGEI